MSRDDARDRVVEIMAALRKAREFVGSMTLADFAADDKTLYAVIRDKLIHDYIGVNTEVVWRTVVDEIPPVLAALAAIGPSDDEAGRA